LSFLSSIKFYSTSISILQKKYIQANIYGFKWRHNCKGLVKDSEAKKTFLGPRHTQYFCTQNWDKMMKIYFFLQNIAVTFKKNFKLGFNKHNSPKINIFNSHRKKVLDEKCLFIFLLQFIFISILCEKLLCVTWAIVRLFMEATYIMHLFLELT